MALITSYATLQSEALDAMERAGQQDDKAPTWIQLAEARLNRELGAVEIDSTITGTVGSRIIDISALSLVAPIALWLSEVGRDQREVQLQPPGTVGYLATSGRPAQAFINGTNLQFDRELDGSYPFRLRHTQRFALSDSAPTNWLLDNHPDCYFAATIMWGAGYNEDWPNGQVWKSVLDEAIPSIRHAIARTRRGVLRVDPALSARSGYSYSDWMNG